MFDAEIRVKYKKELQNPQTAFPRPLAFWVSSPYKPRYMLIQMKCSKKNGQIGEAATKLYKNNGQKLLNF